MCFNIKYYDMMEGGCIMVIGEGGLLAGRLGGWQALASQPTNQPARQPWGDAFLFNFFIKLLTFEVI